VDPSYTSTTCRDVGASWSPKTSEYNIWMRESGVTPSGEKANDMLPNEPGGDSRLMPPKPLVSVNLSGRLLIHKCS